MDFESLIEEPDKPYNIRYRCIYFAKEVILYVRDCRFEKVYSSLYDQLIRSSSSIGANLVEGKAGSSKKDWKRYYDIALKSSNESKYWLCLIRDTLETDKDRINKLLKEAVEISKIIASIIMNSGK